MLCGSAQWAIALAALTLEAQSVIAGFATWTAEELRKRAKSMNTPDEGTLPRREGSLGR